MDVYGIMFYSPPGPLWISALLLSGPPWQNKVYLTLQAVQIHLKLADCSSKLCLTDSVETKSCTVLKICGRPRRPKSLPGNQFLVKLRGWLSAEKTTDNLAK